MSSPDIRTYDGLVAAVQAWLDSGEGALINSIPNMIAMAEADFQRNIVAPDTEATVTINPAATTLPTDLASIRSFGLNGNYQHVLTPVTPAEFAELPTYISGAPYKYVVSNNSLSVWPKPNATYSATLIYQQAIPALSATNQTNWLLTAHPDAYLFGALLQAEFFGWNDTRLSLIQAKLASIIDDINTAGNRKRYGGPLVMRANICDTPR